MTDIYCPKCGRGYIEEIDRITEASMIKGETEFNMYGAVIVIYRCNDCEYEFAGEKIEVEEDE